jgi:hypothetical protein
MNRRVQGSATPTVDIGDWEDMLAIPLRDPHVQMQPFPLWPLLGVSHCWVADNFNTSVEPLGELSRACAGLRWS